MAHAADTLTDHIRALGSGRADEWGTYALWDGDADHPMKVGLSLCPEARWKTIRRYVPWPIEIVLVVRADLESWFWQTFEKARDVPRHPGWTEWYLDPRLVKLIESVGYAATASR